MLLYDFPFAQKGIGDANSIKIILRANQKFLPMTDSDLEMLQEIKGGAENLGIWATPTLIFKLLGINTGWIKENLEMGRTREDLIAEEEFSSNHANSELQGSIAAFRKLQQISISRSVKLLIPFKHLAVTYKHPILNKKLVQLISVSERAKGAPLAKILEGENLPNFISLLGKRIAEFHLATIKYDDSSDSAEERLSDLPSYVRKLKAQLHGDLQPNNIFLNGETVELIDCEAFGRLRKLPVVLEIVYFLVALERILLANGKNPHMEYFFEFLKVNFITSYFNQLSESKKWGEIQLQKLESIKHFVFDAYNNLKNKAEILRNPVD
ncbi:MAG: hypothetical protein H6731_02035 [Myxococcales bacterium]|nr:MAG: hypothetical protein H6731_02035 [Myxococcales bacterium]